MCHINVNSAGKCNATSISRATFTIKCYAIDSSSSNFCRSIDLFRQSIIIITIKRKVCIYCGATCWARHKCYSATFCRIGCGGNGIGGGSRWGDAETNIWTGSRITSVVHCRQIGNVNRIAIPVPIYGSIFRNCCSIHTPTRRTCCSGVSQNSDNNITTSIPVIRLCKFILSPTRNIRQCWCGRCPTRSIDQIKTAYKIIIGTTCEGCLGCSSNIDGLCFII